MITPIDLQSYLLNKPGTTEEQPFGPDVSVYKVLGKMFALLPDDPPLRISLKCDPDEALFLRDMYPAVQPGYHLHKKHWNTVTVDGTIPKGEIWGMIDMSYNLVVKGLKKADRNRLQNM